jgi:hypothetical protein
MVLGEVVLEAIQFYQILFAWVQKSVLETIRKLC